MPLKKSTPVTKPAAKRTAKPASKPVSTTTARKPPTTKSTTGPTGKGVAGKKTAAASQKGKAKGVTSPQPKAPVWTMKDECARTIQKYVRRHLAKKQLKKLKEDKQSFEEMMEKLQKEAWLKIVQIEREQAERERQKEEEERRQRKEEAKRRARILEAAFDGDDDEILAVLEETYTEDQKNKSLSEAARESRTLRHQMALVDCEDANANTPLSEAASGGHSETILMLVQKGANVNSRGKYCRTPIWRAAFAGHLQAVQTLLENGGDPRLIADDGTNAVQVAAIAAVEKVLSDWDITQTDALIAKINGDREKRREEETKRQQMETNRLEDEIKEAEKENDACQKELTRAYCELNKRIFEHDSCISEGKTDKKDITIQAIHDAEAILEVVKKRAETAKDKLSKAKLKLREQVKQDKKEDEANLQGIKVMIRDLDEVLFRDVGGKIAADGRWPLLIDPSGQSSLFLRYRDTNYINALNPKQVEQEVIRLAILGAISHDGGATWTTITFQSGMYSYDDRNYFLHQTMKQNLHWEAEGKYDINIVFVLTTFKVVVEISGGYQLDFRQGGFSELIGFNNKVISQTEYGTKLPNITNSIDGLCISTDIISDSLVNGVASNTLAVIPTDNLVRSYPFTVEPKVAFSIIYMYGKPLVLDMMEVDMFDTMAMKFDEVQNGLLASIMSKEILKDNKFLQLVRPGDGEQYCKTAFLGARIENFILVIITQQWNPPEKLLDQTYAIRIIIPSLPDL